MFKDVDNREIFCEELLPVLDCAITEKRLIQQTVHIIFHNTKSGEVHCAIRYIQISVQLPFTAWNYFSKQHIVICLAIHCSSKLQLNHKHFWAMKVLFSKAKALLVESLHIAHRALFVSLSVQFIMLVLE
jgi:hypothetical protein